MDLFIPPSIGQVLSTIYNYMHELSRTLSILSTSEDLELQAPVEKGWVKIKFVDKPRAKCFVHPSYPRTIVEVANSTVPIPPHINLGIEDGSFGYAAVPSVIIEGDQYTESHYLGFNILRFDILLLIQKGVEHGVGGLAELNKLWHDTYTIDYFQTTLPFHDMKFKDLKVEYLTKIAKSVGVEVPEPFGSGEDVKSWYENGEHDKIVKHLKTDLMIVRIIDLNYKRVYSMCSFSL